MTIYRLAHSKYKDDLHGEGAALYGGRWNPIGVPVLYATQHISLAVLKLLVNYNPSESPFKVDFYLLELDLHTLKPHVVTASSLKKNWQHDLPYTQFIGNQFLLSNVHVALQVPSAVVPEENNYLLNPQHKDFKKILLKYSKKYPLDQRLF
ncbi:MAG: RES family NAD+ phosphorylase [Bacteroidetes bacterium]|nr:RES family NAD+ phosphorylase [Bacteroidota bacterium]